MKKLVYIFAIICFSIFISCTGNRHQSSIDTRTEGEILNEVDPAYDPDMVRSASDTTVIIDLARKYLELLQQNKINDALSMLEEIDTAGVKPLSDERKAVLLENYRRFPVLSYKIEEFHLYTENNTDVRFIYEFIPKPEGQDNFPNTMKGVLSPQRVDGTWHLTILPDLVDYQINNQANNPE